MNKTNNPAKQISIGLAVALLAVFTGCGGYVGVDGGYGGTVIVPDPVVGIYGGGYYGGYRGGYDRGRDVHGFSQRGAVSRGVAHGGGGRGGKR